MFSIRVQRVLGLTHPTNQRHTQPHKETNAIESIEMIRKQKGCGRGKTINGIVLMHHLIVQHRNILVRWSGAGWIASAERLLLVIQRGVIAITIVIELLNALIGPHPITNQHEKKRFWFDLVTSNSGSECGAAKNRMWQTKTLVTVRWMQSDGYMIGGCC